MNWLDKPERGSSAMIHFIVWLSLSTHRAVGRGLLYPICLYFCLFSASSRTASRKYLSRLFRLPASLRQIYWHHLTYARVILDRVFFLSGRLDEFDVSVTGQEIVTSLLAQKRGFIFLGAHQGSFDVLRVMARRHVQLPMKIMMYPDNSQRLMSVVRELNPEMAEEIILLGRPNSMLLAKQHLDQGGIIGILGDRITKGDKLIRSTFLGHPVDLPAGPFLLASALKIPVVLFYGHYLGGARYEIHFEFFAEQIILDRQNRDADLRAHVDHYAARLDDFCHRAPYNWFNFYDFWQTSDTSS